jgi:hypothetical protein
MKKARIALAAIAIFATIGGAFAFNATRNTQTFYRTAQTTLANGVITTYCTQPFQTSYSLLPTFQGQASTSVSSFFSTATSVLICPTLTVYTVIEG